MSKCCARPHHARGMCRAHYDAWYREKKGHDLLMKSISARFHRNIRTRVNQACGSLFADGHPTADLGCSIPSFIRWIELQFVSGMSFSNYGQAWELDHKRPLYQFVLSDRDQYLEAVNWRNMQPLFKSDHKKKTKNEREKYHSERENYDATPS